MNAPRFFPPVGLFLALITLSMAADPPTSSSFAIPLFRYSSSETSSMWIFNGGSRAIPVDILVAGRNVSLAEDIAEPIPVSLGEIPAGATRSFTGRQIIEAEGQKKLSLEYTYEFSITMVLDGADVFVRTAVEVLGLTMTLDANKKYAISGASATPATKIRFTIPVFPHRQETIGYLWIFNNNTQATAVNVTLSGQNLTEPGDIEPANFSLDPVPKLSNRQFTTVDLLGKAGLTNKHDYDLSVVIEVDNPDVHMVASGDAGAGRRGFPVDKKFVRGPSE